MILEWNVVLTIFRLFSAADAAAAATVIGAVAIVSCDIKRRQKIS